LFTSGAALQAIQDVRAHPGAHLADVFTSSVGATAPGGHPSQMSPEVFPTIESPEEAAQFVDARIREGADYIKIIYDDRFGRPSISPETLAALVAAAHARNKLALVHIGTEAQARQAVLAGADGLAHLFTGESLGA